MQNGKWINFLVSAGSPVANTLYSVLFAIISVAVIAVAVWLLTRYMTKAEVTSAVTGGVEGAIDSGAAIRSDSKPKAVPQINFTALLLFVLAIGLILRLIFTFVTIGYRPEFNKITQLMVFVQKNGYSGYYSQANSVFPLTLYVYSFMGMIANLFGADASSVVMPLLVKLPLIAADLLTALVLFKAARRYANGYTAVILAAFVCVFPIFVFGSSVWGSTLSLLTLFTVASLYFVARKNYIALTGLYGASLLFAKEAIYLFPLFAVFLIFNLVKAILAVRRIRPVGFAAIVKNRECAPVVVIPVTIAATMIAMYLIALPAFFGSYGGSFFKYIYHFFLFPLADLNKFGNNSLGIFNLFMRNNTALGANFPGVLFVILFFVLISAVILLIYLSKKNRANLVFLAGYVLFTLATYFVDFHEMSLLPAIGVFLLSFLLVRDKRILIVIGVLGLLTVLNASLVMSSAGFFNNLDASELAALNPTGSLILTGGAGIAATMILSVLAILTHLYATLILLDISMSGKRKLLIVNEKVGFISSLKHWFKK